MSNLEQINSKEKPLYSFELGDKIERIEVIVDGIKKVMENATVISPEDLPEDSFMRKTYEHALKRISKEEADYKDFEKEFNEENIPSIKQDYLGAMLMIQDNLNTFRSDLEDTVFVTCKQFSTIKEDGTESHSRGDIQEVNFYKKDIVLINKLENPNNRE
jgi:hypothetical protein